MLIGCLTFSSRDAIADEPVSPEFMARYLAKNIEIKNQILADYRKLLEVYYELKKKSATPKAFPNYSYDPALAATMPNLPKDLKKTLTSTHVKIVYEFNFELYREFQNELDSDPRLRGNAYLQRMKEYSNRGGAANDIFQRIGSYSFETFEKLSPKQQGELYDRVGSPVVGQALAEAQQTFSEVSKASGYPRNFSVVDAVSKKRWDEIVQAHTKSLAKELKAIGFKVPRKPRAAAKVAAKACPADFARLVK